MTKPNERVRARPVSGSRPVSITKLPGPVLPSEKKKKKKRKRKTRKKKRASRRRRVRRTTV